MIMLIETDKRRFWRRSTQILHTVCIHLHAKNIKCRHLNKFVQIARRAAVKGKIVWKEK